MASCVRNICIKNYQNLIIGFKVTVENVGDVFLGHSVFLAAGRLRQIAFSQEIPESNYRTSTTSVVVSHSLRQRFACRRTQLSSLEVVIRDVDLTSKLIYNAVMHTTPDVPRLIEMAQW